MSRKQSRPTADGRELRTWRHRRPTPDRPARGPRVAGWSLSETGRFLDVDPATVCAWESGRRPVPTVVMLLIRALKNGDVK